MKKDDLDEMLTEALREYVKNTEVQSEEVSKVKFSQRHEKNMEQLFKSVADGTFENFDDDGELENDKNNVVELKNSKHIYIKYAKVAVFILLGLVASLAIAPSMSAWRKEELGLYGDEMDDYAWGLRNDKTEILEAPKKNIDEYVNKFGYLPEGVQVSKVEDNPFYLYIQFEGEDNKNFIFKLTKKINNAIDMEETGFEKCDINDFEIMYVEKSGESTAIWFKNEKEYRLYGDIDWNETIGIISNIKYKEFEEKF